MELTKDFSGVFNFTNPTDEDFVHLWNNKEYTFPANKTVPLIVANESLENIQEIRKRFAYDLAMREFYKGKIYRGLVDQGNKSAGGVPPLFDERLLEPMIEQCLKPMPSGRATVKEIKKDLDSSFKGSKAIGRKDNVNAVFKDDPIKEVGAMPDSPMN